MTAVEHDAAGKRFVARVDGGEAELTYLEPEAKVLELVHTFVPEEARGQKVGDALAEEAFIFAREQGYRIRPTCPFVKHWLEGHAGERELVAGPG
jgi:predicted GNAT family acetyltransferase